MILLLPLTHQQISKEKFNEISDLVLGMGNAIIITITPTVEHFLTQEYNVPAYRFPYTFPIVIKFLDLEKAIAVIDLSNLSLK